MNVKINPYYYFEAITLSILNITLRLKCDRRDSKEGNSASLSCLDDWYTRASIIVLAE